MANMIFLWDFDSHFFSLIDFLELFYYLKFDL